ncbi:MAG: AAA family ATPase, partial [Lentisphaeria bacterium]
LPEAQMDRFMFKVNVDYPSVSEELEILQRMGKTVTKIDVEAVSSPEVIGKLRELVDQVYMDEKVSNYIVRLVDATRNPSKYNLSIAPYVRYGASPRATIFLSLAARAHALIQGRGFVSPHDVKSIAMDVLRHRIALSYDAEADEISCEYIVNEVLNSIEVP